MTDAVLESVYRRQEKGFVRNKNNVKEKSVLHAIKWHRIILDEGDFPHTVLARLDHRLMDLQPTISRIVAATRPRRLLPCMRRIAGVSVAHLVRRLS